MVPAKDPATVSYHPTDQGMIRLQPASSLPPACLQPSFLSRASLCAAISPMVLLALSMAPMVAWLSTGERSTSVLCCRLAWTSRRMSVNVTSLSDRSKTLTSDRPHASNMARKNCTNVSLAALLAFPVHHVEDGQPRVHEMHTARQKHEIAFHS